MVLCLAMPAAGQTSLRVGEAPTTNAAALDPAQVDHAIASVADIVDRARTSTGVPVVAVGVVDGGAVVHL